MKTTLKIILVSLFLSLIIAKAETKDPFLGFDINNNTVKHKGLRVFKTIENMTVEEMQSLLDQGFDVNQDYHGINIFTRIIIAGIINVVALLIESGADIHAPANGRGPLHYAASSNHPEIIQLLIDAGIDIDVRTDYDTTPLFDAASPSSIDAARKLLQLGADPNIPVTYDGSTAFMVAVKYASYPDEDYYTAEDAARDKAKGITRLTILELLVEYGADPHAVDNEGNNARTYIYPDDNFNANRVRSYLDELGVK